LPTRWWLWLRLANPSVTSQNQRKLETRPIFAGRSAPHFALSRCRVLLRSSGGHSLPTSERAVADEGDRSFRFTKMGRRRCLAGGRLCGTGAVDREFVRRIVLTM